MEYIIKNIVLLSGEKDMQPEKGKAILVKDGRIAEIFDENKTVECKTIYDMGGKTLLPGLINLHCHIPTSGKPSKKKVDYAKLAKLLNLGPVRSLFKMMTQANAKNALMSGVTTIRTVGGLFDFDGKARDAINAGKKVGPRILCSNYAVSVPGGHMTGTVALPAGSVEEVVAMIHDLDKTHPDLIKLMITGGVMDAKVLGEPGILKMPPEYVKVACEEAHKLGYKVAAHVESTEGMVVALENGVDSIEHGGKPTDEIIKMFKEKGATLTCTLSPAIPFSKLSTEFGLNENDAINGKALLSNMVECVKACLEAGIPVGLGTDSGAPGITQYAFWREPIYFCQFAGVTPQFALYTATKLNAELCGLGQETGSIEVGKSADFLLVDGNPLEDLKVLANPKTVVFKGNIIANPKPKKFAELDKLLDTTI